MRIPGYVRVSHYMVKDIKRVFYISREDALRYLAQDKTTKYEMYELTEDETKIKKHQRFDIGYGALDLLESPELISYEDLLTPIKK